MSRRRVVVPRRSRRSGMEGENGSLAEEGSGHGGWLWALTGHNASVSGVAMNLSEWENTTQPSWNTTQGGIVFCDVWEAAQHNLFQTANLFLAAAFLVPKNFKQNILLVRALLSIGFLVSAVWGGFNVCGPDILAWNMLLSLVNLGHTILLTMRFLPPRLSLELTDLYLKQFRPLRVGKKHFKELTREAQTLKLNAGDTYAVEDITPADEKLSILLKGKLKVTCDEAHLHFIHPYQFIDSPEWVAFHESTADIFQVTIEAEEDCLYLCWPRIRLERVLRHRTLLRQVFESMIGKDITHKLYSLNEHLGGLKTVERDKWNEACRKNLNRSLSLDAVNTARNGNVRSQAWKFYPADFQIIPDESSPVRSRQAHMWLPIVASHFSPDYPFTHRQPGTSPAHLAAPGPRINAQVQVPIITDKGTFNIPPAPAAPVALVPVMVPVLAPALQAVPVQPSTPIKRTKSTRTAPTLRRIFSRDKEVKFETPV